jgi:DNA-binding transcriptional ArsR family regulator
MTSHRLQTWGSHELTYSHMGMYKECVARAATTSDPFNAIAEPNRRHILEFIAGEERSVTEIVDALELGQPSVSKHLQVLRDVGLVRMRRQGRRTLYRIDLRTLRTIHEWSGMFAQHWRGQLRRIKTHAEEER